jgi:hypothetical protein
MDTKLLDQMNDQEKFERRQIIQDKRDLAILLEAKKIIDKLYTQ